MANDLTQNPLILDTAATTLLQDGPCFIKSVRWVNATTAGHTAVLQDAESNVWWDSIASGANYVEEDMIERWVTGIRLTTIGSGKVYVELG